MKIGQEQQILVEVGEFEFCIDLDEVISIINPPKMVRLPSARGAFIRAFKYQDELGAAVSMRVKFAQPERTDMQTGQILLGRLNGRLAGFWFDKVTQILKLGDGAEWYPIPAGEQLPTPEFDTFVRYRDRLIPHTSLMGLLRFEQAEAWKQWVAEHKPRLEAGILAAEQEAAEAEARAREAARAAATPAMPVSESIEPLITMEEFYALMDEAGVGEVEPEPGEPEVQEAEEVLIPEQEETETVEAEEESPLPLAVPVNPPEEEPDTEAQNQLTVSEPQETESESVAEPEPTPEREASGEDAMFSLERKRDKIRKRMNPESDANLGDYSIIKVGDKSLLRWLRRWLRRLVWMLLLAAVVFVGVQGVQYQQQRGLGMEQLWVRNPTGETDWPATRQAVEKELVQFGRFLRESLKVK